MLTRLALRHCLPCNHHPTSRSLPNLLKVECHLPHPSGAVWGACLLPLSRAESSRAREGNHCSTFTSNLLLYSLCLDEPRAQIRKWPKENRGIFSSCWDLPKLSFCILSPHVPVRFSALLWRALGLVSRNCAPQSLSSTRHFWGNKYVRGSRRESDWMTFL